MTMMDVGRSIITYFYWEEHLCGQLAKEYIENSGKHHQQGWQRGQKGNKLTNAKGAGKYHLCLCLKICKAKSYSEYRKHNGNLVKLCENSFSATTETNTGLSGKKLNLNQRLTAWCHQHASIHDYFVMWALYFYCLPCKFQDNKGLVLF